MKTHIPQDDLKRRKTSEENEAPLTLDASARRNDESTTESVPEDIRIGLASARVTVTLSSAKLKLDEGTHLGTYKKEMREIVLPEGSFVGITIQETKLHKHGSLAVPSTSPKPHRPGWVPLSHCVRPSGIDRALLRRRSGRIVIPTDSGRAYGEYPARQPFYPSGYPWGCIGRLFVWADVTSPNWTSYGAAVLVGSRTVLTAAHMIPWGATGNAKILFVAGYYDGTSSSGPGGQSWATNVHGYVGNDVSAHDMAVLRLQDPLGNWLGYLGTKAYADNWEGGAYWHLVGYPSAVTSERPSWQGGIHVIDDDEDGDAQELEHHGDDTGGDSGGPFFGIWDDGPYVIGTVSGYEEVSGVIGIGSEDNNIVAGGPALNAIVHYARQTWTFPFNMPEKKGGEI